jgi:hypothetical protein
MMFLSQSGSCVSGTIQNTDIHTITVRSTAGSVVLKREELLQVRQGDALVFSGRSSWADVTGVHFVPHEALIVNLKNGKQVTGKPAKVNADELILKHGLAVTRYAKSEVATVDYVRVKPESDGFDYLAQEAPAVLWFDPETYARMVGLEGTIIVRLYDSTKPESTTPATCP